MKKGRFLLLSLALICIFTFAGCEEDENKILKGKHHATIEVEDYGTIKVELDADEAPLTVTNFVKLAKKGFYNGLTFYRVVDGFVIEGGDPLKNGRGSSDDKIKGEFSANGIDNSISHVRGTISMARKDSDYNGASCQFFIVQSDATQLDGQYAGFGHVTEGMDIVDQICTDTAVDENGNVAVEDQPVIKKIKIKD